MGKKLKVMGLALIAVCAFGVISAAGAQASAHWMVEGKTLGSGVSETVETNVELTKLGSESTPSVTLTVPGFIRITCTSLAIEEGKITGTAAGTSGTDSASALKFTGCIVLDKNGAATNCTVSDNQAGAVVGTIRTLGNTSKLVNGTGSLVYDIFTPLTGPMGELVTLVVAHKPNFTCALAGIEAVKGTVGLELQVGTNATKLEGTTSEAIEKAASATLTYGAREAFLDGTGDLKLASGKTWGVEAS